MTSLEFDFQNGFNETIRRLEFVERRPILAGVYGAPGSGKSTFMTCISDYFEARGLEVADHGGAPDASNFERYRDRSWEYQNMLILFHCAWFRKEEEGGLSCSRTEEDPNVLSRQILGRTLDLNVGIYNPNIHSEIEGNYDLIIRNQH